MKNINKKLAIIFIALTSVGCTAPESAREHLKEKKYSNIELGGSNPFVCTNNDLSTKFKATAENGDKVSGTVCTSIIGSYISFISSPKITKP